MKYEIYATLSLLFGKPIPLKKNEMVPCGTHAVNFTMEFDADDDKDAQLKLYKKVEEWKNQFYPMKTLSTMEENMQLAAPIVESPSQPSLSVDQTTN